MASVLLIVFKSDLLDMVVHHLLLLCWLKPDLWLPPGWSSGCLLGPDQALAHSFGQGLDKIRILEATNLCRLFLL